MKIKVFFKLIFSMFIFFLFLSCYNVVHASTQVNSSYRKTWYRYVDYGSQYHHRYYYTKIKITHYHMYISGDLFSPYDKKDYYFAHNNHGTLFFKTSNHDPYNDIFLKQRTIFRKGKTRRVLLIADMGGDVTLAYKYKLKDAYTEAIDSHYSKVMNTYTKY